MKRDVTALPVTIALWASWAALCAPTLAWFGKVLAQADARFNLVLLAALVVVVAWRELGVRRASRGSGAASPAVDADPLAAVLVVASCFLYVLASHVLRINAVQGVCCGLALYGLVGRHLPRATFRAGFPVAALAILLLPMGGHMDTYLGFPLRLVTAEVVERTLAPFAMGAVKQETIILFENAAAHVDLPCSGIRSLWSGAMFFCAASWLVRARLGFGWMAKGVVFVALLLGANLVRVLVLSALALFAKDPTAAQVVHVPLGVLGFTLACAAAFWMLKSDSRVSKLGTPTETETRSEFRFRWVSPIVMILFALVPAPAALPVETHAAELVFAPPVGLALEPDVLTAIERKFLDGNGAHYTRKWRFKWRGGETTGSLLIVAARSWRAHHPPEQCMAGAGMPLAGLETALLGEGFPVRVVNLASPAGRAPRATYWFQAPDKRTDDYGARVWDSLRGERSWLMVSLLFDDDVALDAPGVRDLHQQISAAARPLLGDKS